MNTKILLYADNTSIANSPNPYNCQIITKETFFEIKNWFRANLLSLNL